jgi:hypothetical protein
VDIAGQRHEHDFSRAALELLEFDRSDRAVG